MSFTSKVKEEIFKNVNIKKECCEKAETFGEKITTNENKKSIEKELLNYFSIESLKECCIKSIIKGSFLANGYINDPQSIYHLEIIFKSKTLANYYIHLLNILDLTPKIIKRKNNYVVYLKESEQLSRFLSILEANNSMLYFEEVRVEKNVKNNINRKVNCEVYNLSKTLKSNNKQIEAINKISKYKKYNELNDKLKDVIELRVRFPEDTLNELSKKMNISKSGLNHRINKIMEIASKL